MKGHEIIKGRQWRITDPGIPEPLRQQLVNALMAARRGVAAANRSGSAEALARARRGVQFAKVALGERGPIWWESMSEKDLLTRAEATLFSLLSQRAENATLCPSEVSRAIGGEDWRVTHPLVVSQIWGLADQQLVQVMQGGHVVSRGVKGPFRVGCGPRFDAWSRDR